MDVRHFKGETKLYAKNLLVEKVGIWLHIWERIVKNVWYVSSYQHKGNEDL